jgi:hypothetical protein
MYHLLGIVKETDRCIIKLQQLELEGKTDTTEAKEFKQKVLCLKIQGKNQWVDIIQTMQDNEDGMKLLDDNSYFKVLDFVLDTIFRIENSEGFIVNVQPLSPRHPKKKKVVSRAPNDLEEEKVPLNKD